MALCLVCDEVIGDEAARRTGGFCTVHEYMDKVETARRLHVATGTVDRLIREGRLRRIRPLRGVLIRRGDVEQLLAQ